MTRSAWIGAIEQCGGLYAFRSRLAAWIAPGPRAGDPLSMAAAVALIAKLRGMLLDKEIELMATRGRLRASDGRFFSIKPKRKKE